MSADRPWLLRDPSRLADVAPGWSSLVTSASPPTQYPEWTDAALRSVSADDELRLVGVGHPERPRALAPLCRTPGSLEPLRPPGAMTLGEPADLLYADTAAAEELLDALLELGMPVALPRLPTDSDLLRAAVAAGHRRAMVMVRPGSGAPYIELDEDWQDPEARLSTSRRGALRRARRRAQDLGELTLDLRRPAPAETAAVLDEAYRVEAKSWKGEGSAALECDPERGSFFRRHLRAAAEDGRFLAGFLRMDGKAIATQLSVESETHHWVLKIGYDEDYARCSPGNLLTADLIQDVAARGLVRYEFLGRPSPWIDAWTASRRELTRLMIYPMGPRGVAFGVSRVAARAAGKVRRGRPWRDVRVRSRGRAS